MSHSNDAARVGILRLASVLFSLTLLVPCTALAQAPRTGAATAPASAASGGEVIEMKPFEVDASNDTRYRAANTLAGSRLNTPLKDVSSVIDVYTKDFMQDVGATDLEGVLSFANNLERDTEDTIHGQGNLNISTNTNFRYRIRGLSASRARNYFEYDYPIDTYITDRLDESRGPNSILFGFGSPGGIVNASTKRAMLSRNLAEVEFKTGTEIDNRETIDLNRVIIDDRLALRFNGLHQEKTGWRKYTYDDSDAFDVALAAKPFSKTLINVDYERYRKDDSVARPLTYWSYTDTWDAAGGPLIYSNYSNRNNSSINPGLDTSTIAQLSGSNYWVVTGQTGDIANWRRMSRSNRANYTAPDGTVYTRFADYRTNILTPPGIIEVNTMGPSTGRNLDLESLFATLAQEVTRDFQVELAMTRHYSDWRSRRIPATSLFADPNAYLPQGGATSTGPASSPELNPFAGGYYVETVPQYWRTTIDTFDYRATASYDLRLPGIWGEHRFGLLWERDDTELLTRTLQEQVLVNGSLASTAPNNTANQLRRRYYVDPSNPGSVRNADVLDPSIPLDMTLADGTHLTSRYYNYTSAPPDYTKTNDVLMLVAQSKWWDERINTIIGIRRDKVEFDDWGSYVADGQGGYMRSEANRSIVPYDGRTNNYGVVFHVTDWLSLFANRATSVGVPELKVIYAPNGEFMDPTEGKGTDVGIKFSLPNGRIAGTLTYYEAASTNETDNQAVESWGVNGNNAFLDALVAEGLLSQTEANPMYATGTGDTVDSQTKGVEFNLAGAITPHWDVRLNYSHTDRSITNAFPRINAWADNVLRPFWQTWDRDNPNTPAADNILDTVTSGSSTLRDIIDNFEANLESRTVARSKVTGLRPDKANVFTTYSFDEGPLHGLRIGGGVRWDAANYARQDDLGNTIRGRSFTSVDLMASYSREVFSRPCVFQINVRNAFNDDPEVGPSVINPAGTWNALIIQPPREITFTFRMSY